MRLRATVAALIGVTAPALAQIPMPAPMPASMPAPMLAPVATPVSVAAPSEAVATLIRQAQRWLQQNRPELAALSIQRALAADPRNVAALVVAAQVEAARNNPAAARGFAGQLQQAGATAEQRAAADTAIRGATLDQGAIEQARALAREGRTEEAAARYRAIFGAGGPTPPYALEYYQTLAGSTGSKQEGSTGLSRLAAQPGASDRTLLANAQTLTFQPASRAEGIRQLAALADKPAVAADARAAWRQALVFSGKDPAAAPMLQAYLAKFPDPDLSRQLEAIRAAPVGAPSPSDTLRQQGFAQLDSGALPASAARFEAALAANPKDADALGGLGIVRLRENKLGEARDLLSRAVAADPAGAAKWQQALDGASYGAELGEARALLRRGNVEGADGVARAAARRQVPDQSDAEELLGEIALRRRDPVAAEQHFRATLARKPGFAPAMSGLNQAMRAQNRAPEFAEPARAPAQTAAASFPPSYPPSSSPSSPVSAEATTLRSEAASTSDPAVAAALLRNAVGQAPNDPWTRLDLARVLRRQGRASEGRALMEEIAARAATPDANFAAALFADEDGRPADAEALLSRIPPARRTADMGRLSQRIRASAEVARAVAGLSTGGADGRLRLITLAARPDPSGATAAASIRALGEAGDRAGAAEAARAAEAANRAAGPTARIAIAGALLSAGLETEAGGMADQLEAGVLAPEQRRDVASLRAGIAIRASDRLNEAGQQSAAFERLRPVLSQSPENADAQLALGRLYQNARKPEQALRIAQGVLARDPRNLDARRGAVEAAIATGDRRRAEALVAEAEALTPNDSRVLLLQARVARGFGDESGARVILARAGSQRRAELGVSATATGTAATVANPFGPNLQLAAADLPADPTARDIAREAEAVRQETRPTGAVVPMLRSRTGSGGLDKLNEYAASAEATITPPGIAGRLTARLMATSIDEGKLTGGTAALNKFGANAAFGTSAVPRQTSAAGAGVGIAYNRADSIKVELGTTPLGFPKASFSGGIEIAPRLSDNIRLRLTAERRSVTDSLLSYAGTRDPVTGTRWGMVEHSGGHGQIEATLGAGTAYAGGGYQVFDGTHVVSNTRIDAGAGYAVPLYKDADSSVTSGIDLIYLGYAKAVEGFTLGQGGYFSPQYFYAANIPLDYRGRSGDFGYHLGVTAGYVRWREEASPLFPLDAILQAQADAAAKVNPAVISRNAVQGRSGLTAGLRVDADYDITPTLKLSGGVAYDKAASWNETRVTVRLQNQF